MSARPFLLRAELVGCGATASSGDLDGADAVLTSIWADLMLGTAVAGGGVLDGDGNADLVVMGTGEGGAGGGRQV
jgi:hypothetical protein